VASPQQVRLSRPANAELTAAAPALRDLLEPLESDASLLALQLRAELGRYAEAASLAQARDLLRRLRLA
jgi:hypothetical protein